MKYLLSIIILSLVVLSACAPTINNNDPIAEPQDGTYFTTSTNLAGVKNIEPFSSIEEYNSFASLGSLNNYYGGFGGSMMRGDVVFEEMAMLDSGMPKSIKTSENSFSGSTNDVEFSETNNQVQGVDEADIIKTDGKYVYTITGKTLFIISAGEDAELISQVSLDSYANGIFIYENTLAIFGNEYDETVYDMVGFRPKSGMTYFKIYDMSDRTNLNLKEEYSFEGNYFNARLIENQVYFTVKSSPEVRPVHPLPIMYKDGVVKEVPLDRMMWYPGNYNNAQLVTVHSINLNGNKDIESLSVAIDNAQTLYMSKNNLFILGNEYISEYDLEKEVTKTVLSDVLTTSDKELIALIKGADNRIISQQEKEQKIMEVYYQRINYFSSKEQITFYKEVDEELSKKLKEIKYFTYTSVAKISVDDGSIDFIANGKVPGRTVNQFSLDELNNDLRIATTVEARWSRNGDRTDSYTNIYVLDENLDQIGELTNLAPTERIYSTRFVGERLYMVTFKQVDPFFVIDLSNPKKPTVLGELKIPGFSRYLHPYDKNHIIGIGQDATEMGRTTGLKISLYNVEDVEHPIEVANYITDERYASSSALYEHKAFLFSKEKNLLVIPVYSWGWNGGDKYNGAFVFNINTEEIELRGLIDHSIGDKYFQQVERSLYINNLLYTKSPQLLRINNLDNLEGIQNIDLKEKIGIPIF